MQIDCIDYNVSKRSGGGGGNGPGATLRVGVTSSDRRGGATGGHGSKRAERQAARK